MVETTEFLLNILFLTLSASKKLASLPELHFLLQGFVYTGIALGFLLSWYRLTLPVLEGGNQEFYKPVLS